MVEAREYALWLEEWERKRAAKNNPSDNTLVIWKQGLVELPTQITATKHNLMVVDLRYNRIRELPDDLSCLNQVIHLDLTGNALPSLPAGIHVLTELKGLFLAKNKLETLPSEIGHLPYLEVLRLEGNALFELTYHIGGLSLLRELRLENNRLTTLPPEVALLTSLNNLGLAGNPLITPSASRVRDAAPVAKDEPPITSYIQDEREADYTFKSRTLALSRDDHDMLLQFLAEQLLAQDYSHSQLTEAPDSALRTTSLLSLNLSHNDLPACLPVDIAGLKSLGLLNVSYNMIEYIPDALTTLHGLQELNVSHNRLFNTCSRKRMEEDKVFSLALGENLTCLKTLLLGHNKLSWIPAGVLSCGLRILDVCHNDIEFVPDFQLHHEMPDQLRVLNLGNNHIREIDAQFLHRLRSIEMLVIESNLLYSLPPLGSISGTCKMLWAGSNRLESVPPSIGQLTNLKSLRLDKNLLQTVPVEVGMCTLIEDFNLLNNPRMYQPPEEMLIRGTAALLAYMQRLLQAKSLHTREQVNVLELSQEELEAEMAAEESDGEEQGVNVDDEDGEAKKKERKPTGTELFAASMEKDAAGDAIPHKVDVSKNSAVKYLNQDCKILRVYSEGAKIFCDVQQCETGQMFVRIKHDMVSG